jgi:2-hydroxychromene-2-carboxylate isomerase
MVYRFAHDLNLDMEVFNYDFSSSEIYSSILKNYNKIASAGIYGTPTILIDGRPVYNSSGLKGMEDKIDRLLE